VTERCPEVATTYSAHLIYRSFGGQRYLETNHTMQISRATMLGTSKCMRPSVAPAARPQSRRSVMVAAHQVIADWHPACSQSNTSSGSRFVPLQTIANHCAIVSTMHITYTMRGVMARFSSRDAADSAYRHFPGSCRSPTRAS